MQRTAASRDAPGEAEVTASRNVARATDPAGAACHRAAQPPRDGVTARSGGSARRAHVAVLKYADGLPLYSQEGMLQRIGIDLPRSTLASWMVKAGFDFAVLCSQEWVQPTVRIEVYTETGELVERR